jgi:HK97 family phage major capsid protein
MKELQNLRERRSAIAQNMKKLLDDNKDKQWENSHQEQYDAMLKEVDAIDREIKNTQAYLDTIADEHVDNAQQENFNDKNKDSKSRDLYAKFLRGGDKAMTAEDWAHIRNTMSTTTGDEGGYTVQTEIAETLIESLKAFGGMREVAEVITTLQGNPMSFPTTNGTAEKGEIIPENTTATGADPDFGTIGLNVYKFSSKVVAVPFELLQDSVIDIESFVNRRLIERLGRITNEMFTVGTGTAQPRGAVTGSTAGKVGASGQTTTITFDDLVDLIHSLDPAYRAMGAGFMMNDASLKVIRKMKDSQNRPIFLPGYDGLAGPMADSVLGYGVTINQDVATMAASAKSILFGDFKKYIIRDAMQATLFRFDDSAYVKLGQIGFLMWMRSGGNLTDAQAIKHYQNAAS